MLVKPSWNRKKEAFPQQKHFEVTDFFSHYTAIIDTNVEIGKGIKVWHFSHLLSGSKIGSNSNIGQNVVIGTNSQIGSECKIQNNISIYEGVIFEDEVFCGPRMVFTNVINPCFTISRKKEFQKKRACKGATFGVNCTIICRGEVGKYAFIGAGAVVTKNVPVFALMVGNLAKQIGWMSKYGERLALPFTGEGKDKCLHTGETYRLKHSICTVIP